MENNHFLQPIPYGASIAVYGSGGRAASLLDQLACYRPDIAVAFFLDSYCAGSFSGRDKFKLDHWLAHGPSCDIIVIASSFYEEIQQQLLDRDVCDFFIFDGDRIIDQPPPLADGFHVFHPPYNIWNRKNLSRFHLGYDDEALFKQIIKRIRLFTMVSLEGLFALADIVRFCENNGLTGAFVECGCWQGGATAMMAAMNLHYGASRRDIHAFDSFQGLPEPIPGKDYVDETQSWFGMPLSTSNFQGRLVATGALATGQEGVKSVVLDIVGYDPNRLFIHPGWFQDTVPQAACEIGPISVLRLDGDLYDSTKVCLEQLYPLVVPGGFIYVDDWNGTGCRVACEEFFQKQGLHPYLHVVDISAMFWIKE